MSHRAGRFSVTKFRSPRCPVADFDLSYIPLELPVPSTFQIEETTREAASMSLRAIHCCPARDGPPTDHMSRCRDYAVNIAIPGGRVAGVGGAAVPTCARPPGWGWTAGRARRSFERRARREKHAGKSAFRYARCARVHA